MTKSYVLNAKQAQVWNSGDQEEWEYVWQELSRKFSGDEPEGNEFGLYVPVYTEITHPDGFVIDQLVKWEERK